MSVNTGQRPEHCSRSIVRPCVVQSVIGRCVGAPYTVQRFSQVWCHFPTPPALLTACLWFLDVVQQKGEQHDSFRPRCATLFCNTTASFILSLDVCFSTCASFKAPMPRGLRCFSCSCSVNIQWNRADSH